MAEVILELQGVTRQYGAVKALDAVDATFFRGEYVCILGPSGCGKSTLLRLVAGFDDPDAGKIILEGNDVRGIQPEKRHVNMVFQNYALFPHLTVFENIAFGLKIKRTPKEILLKKVREVLEVVQLGGLAERYPQQLSGGQQQRVALARAIVNQPGVLLLDEPLAALDKNLRLAMQVELRKLQRSLGITFLHVTHDQSEALTLADRILIMRAGRIEQVGEPGEVYNRPHNRFVAEFLGNANILTGAWDAAKGIATMSSNRQLMVKNNSTPQKDSASAEIMIRPERIQILKHRQALPEHNCFPADVVNVVYAGAETYCQLRAGEWELLAQQLNQQDEPIQVGQQVYVYLPPECIVFLDSGNHKGASL